jgi:hypothetical protein
MSTRRSPHGDVGQMKEGDRRSSEEASPVHETVKVEKGKEMVKLEKGKERDDDGKTYDTAIDLDTCEIEEAKQALDAFLGNHNVSAHPEKAPLM